MYLVSRPFNYLLRHQVLTLQNQTSLSGLETNQTHARNTPRLVLAAEDLVQCNFPLTLMIIA